MEILMVLAKKLKLLEQREGQLKVDYSSII